MIPDCEDIRRLGYATNGTYVVMTTLSQESFPVVCEFHKHETWTLIQRRQDGSEDFYRSWLDYKHGFGSLVGEFWLGNERIHQLTNQDFYRLRIDMWDWPKPGNDVTGKPHVPRYFFAESRYMVVANESHRYELKVPDDYFAYTGFGGSGLRIHAGPFLTKDVKILPEAMRQNCAQKFHSGWWFKTCVRNANFNGRYYKGGYADSSKKQRARDDIYWPNIDQSLQKVVMKIGRVNETYALTGFL